MYIFQKVFELMTINLKQIVTVTGNYIRTHENHKSKAYNRYTKKRKKYKHATEEIHQQQPQVNCRCEEMDMCHTL